MLLDELPGEILGLGDYTYTGGTAAAFANCFGPAFGRHKTRFLPAVGNHEYDPRARRSPTWTTSGRLPATSTSSLRHPARQLADLGAQFELLGGRRVCRRQAAVQLAPGRVGCVGARRVPDRHDASPSLVVVLDVRLAAVPRTDARAARSGWHRPAADRPLAPLRTVCCSIGRRRTR
ncbi:MAG: hypothetical protein R2710_00955 [Acidimicrobiales bacterium]